MVLDRAVMRMFPGGTVMTLTHQIVRVDSKDAVDKWGEIAVPAGAEILTLRTHKRDGSTREPEEIAGKETISAADVAIGDYIEWEYLDTRPPSPAFAPGFLVDRFFFQSFDAPMARSELVLVSPPGIDAGAGSRAPARPSRRRASRSTARASPASWRWACRSCSPSGPRSPRSNTCRRCGRRAASTGSAGRAIWPRSFTTRCARRPSVRAQARTLAERGAQGSAARWPRRWSTG